MSFKNEVIFIAFLALVFYYFSKTDTYKSAVKPKTYITAAEEKIICTETMKRMSAMGQSPKIFSIPLSGGRTINHIVSVDPSGPKIGSYLSYTIKPEDPVFVMLGIEKKDSRPICCDPYFK